MCSRNHCGSAAPTHLTAASSSMAVSGLRKLVTSAMWTPTSTFPPGSERTCRASSMSLHPGGSTLQTQSPRRSSLCGTWVVMSTKCNQISTQTGPRMLRALGGRDVQHTHCRGIPAAT